MTGEKHYDFQKALDLSGLTVARFRYLEKEFGSSIGIETHFFLPARYSLRQIKLLLRFEKILQGTDLAPGEVNRTIRSYLSVRQKGIWVAAVTSGKGGVGKTSLAVNIAVSLSRLGLRPTVVDADLGMANAHLLLGLLPERSLRDLVRGEASMEEIMMRSSFGVQLVPGGSGTRDLADLSGSGREYLAGEIGKLQYSTDTLIIDTGSGISGNVLRFLLLADDILVVITPNVASCVDGLGLVQAAAGQGCNGRMNVLVNRCRTESEGEDVFLSFSEAVNRTTGTAPLCLGYIPEDRHMEDAYQMGMPVTSFSSACGASRGIRKVARTILSDRRGPRMKKENTVLKLFEGLAAAC